MDAASQALDLLLEFRVLMPQLVLGQPVRCRQRLGRHLPVVHPPAAGAGQPENEDEGRQALQFSDEHSL